MKRYDYLIVGAGLFGATCANLLKEKGHSVLVVEKRPYVGGNVYSKNVDGIDVHVHGAHIFHTSNEEVWNYVNRFASFNDFINSPLADYHGERYHLPFNLNTFRELWDDVVTSEDAKKKIQAEIDEFGVANPTNLQEQAISLVGVTVFKKLIKEYTEKQWGKPCDQLPPSIIKRIPVRFYADNNYFNDTYQGIPKEGYTALVEALLKDVEVRLEVDYLAHKDELNSLADNIIYTGSIDEFFSYEYGYLEYRSLEFKTKSLPIPSYQGNAVINYTSLDKPYTRIIEHKFFNYKDTPTTIITEEYPLKWTEEKERYYPVNDEANSKKYQRYLELAKEHPNIHFGGRLGLYRYFDMDDTIEAAFELVKQL